MQSSLSQGQPVDAPAAARPLLQTCTCPLPPGWPHCRRRPPKFCGESRSRARDGGRLLAFDSARAAVPRHQRLLTPATALLQSQRAAFRMSECSGALLPPRTQPQTRRRPPSRARLLQQQQFADLQPPSCRSLQRARRRCAGSTALNLCAERSACLESFVWRPGHTAAAASESCERREDHRSGGEGWAEERGGSKGRGGWGKRGVGVGTLAKGGGVGKGTQGRGGAEGRGTQAREGRGVALSRTALPGGPQFKRQPQRPHPWFFSGSTCDEVRRAFDPWRALRALGMAYE
jgi:hypothetical protein